MKLNHRNFSIRMAVLISGIIFCIYNNVGRAAGIQERSQEELMIKGTYLKLSLYNAAAAKDYAELNKTTYDANSSLRFEINEIHNGPLSEIENQDLYSLATKGKGNIIEVIPHTIEYTNGSEAMITYEAKWKSSEYLSAVSPKKLTIEELKIISPAKYADVIRYTSYKVTVYLNGINRDYKALVLYHGFSYSPNNPIPEFFDLVVGGNILNDVLVENRPPFSSTELKSAAKNRMMGIPTKEKNVSKHAGPSERTPTSPFQCNDKQPMCCPKNASSINECCWNSEYPYENPGIIQECSGASENVRKKVSLLNYSDMQLTEASCSPVRKFPPSLQQGQSNNADHFTNSTIFPNNGRHSYTVSTDATCEQSTDCYRTCRVSGTDSFTESSLLTREFWPNHSGATTVSEQADQGYDDRVYKCQRASGVAVSGCIIPNCGGSVTMNISPGSAIPNGPQASLAVTVSGGSLWSYGAGATTSCSFSSNDSGGSGSGGGAQCGSSAYCVPLSSAGSCQSSSFTSGPCCCLWSPIVIDISRYWDWAPNSGNGYHFTDTAGGVRFDLDGNGIKDQVAWPTATSENAWLALDRNGNGLIDSGKELFGNFTDQVGPAGQPIPTGQGNGWQALAELDRGRSGGNENGMVDKDDAWFPNLRLWVDRNHNGISEPNELLTLASIGLTGIELTYDPLNGWTDQYGNSFKIRSRFKWGDRDDPEFFYTEWFKDAWDVFPLWTP